MKKRTYAGDMFHNGPRERKPRKKDYELKNKNKRYIYFRVKTA